MKKLSQLSKEELQGKRAVVRIDLNVPMGEDNVVKDTDADRIRKAQPTIDFLRSAGATVIILSYIGRDPKESMKPVADYMKIPLYPLIGFDTSKLADSPVVLLENLRSDPREEGNDPEFGKLLASYGDIFINDGFSICHRAYASVMQIPKLLPSYAGLQLEKEIENLNRALNPEHPALLIMGGAKFETKLPVIQKLLPLVENIFIGGALVNNFFKEKGYEVGQSLLDATAHLGELVNDPKIVLPVDVIVQNDAHSDHGNPGKSATTVEPADRIVDVVIPDVMKDIIANAKTIVWNGPMGNYENGFTQGTEILTKMVAGSEGFSIIGGGDSVALIEQLGLEKDFGFLSTGGGAMLEFLAQGTLPGIEALG